MSKKDDLTLVPKYRFPEFKDGEGWEVKELGEILDYLQPTPYLVQTENYDNKYTIPVLTAGKSFILGYTNEQEGIFNNKLPVIIFDDFTTDSKFVDFPFKVKSSAIKILLAKYNFNIKFIFEIMQMVSYEVSVHKRHWISIFSKLKVLIPQSKEQQKIADCLSSIDDLISAEEKKLSLLNDYKKGWMQKLFPAEGKTVPEWRFPEFKDSKGWEKLNIEKACYPSYSGGTPVTSKKEYYNGDIPFIRSGEIGKEKTELFLTSEGLDNSSAKMIEKGDVLMALYGANSGDVAISPIKGAINQAILCLRHKNNNAFLYHYLAFKKNWIVRTYIQGGQGNLSGEIVKSIELCSPQEPEEQNKIAEFLSGIDDLISKQKDKIEVLKQHKKALMQGLFPSIEEV